MVLNTGIPVIGTGKGSRTLRGTGKGGVSLVTPLCTRWFACLTLD